jgi:para-aminobenzoate synthetase component 1
MHFLQNKTPHEVAEILSKQQDYFVFLNSSMATNYSGEKSIIAFGIEHLNEDIISGNDFKSIETKLNVLDEDNTHKNLWFGYFGYGLKNQLEILPSDEQSYITTPDIYFIKPANILVYNHKNNEWLIEKNCKNLESYFTKKLQVNVSDEVVKNDSLELDFFSTNYSTPDYLNKVLEIKNLIADGIIYQANLTRKFFGKFKNEPDGFRLFKKLCTTSPAPYSAYIKFNDIEIISSSPEQFLKVDKNKNAETRPIKGSAGKSLNNQELAKSSKDQAENLMITDLMRNDFARVCNVGSVKVENLFEVAEFKTINHMQSTIKGEIADDFKNLDLVKACFPPGSMTGAPKIKAMEVCTKLENQARGVYSGALGYISGSGEMELSVVIRTIILQNNKFEIQVGGGIIYDSEPEKELQETYTKIKPVAEVLGVFDKILKNTFNFESSDI